MHGDRVDGDHAAHVLLHPVVLRRELRVGDARLLLVQVEQAVEPAGRVPELAHAEVAEVLERICVVAPLEVDDRTHLVTVEHEVHRPGVALHERDALDGGGSVSAQPVDRVGDERIGVAREELLPLLQGEVDLVQRGFASGSGHVREVRRKAELVEVEGVHSRHDADEVLHDRPLLALVGELVDVGATPYPFEQRAAQCVVAPVHQRHRDRRGPECLDDLRFLQQRGGRVEPHRLALEAKEAGQNRAVGTGDVDHPGLASRDVALEAGDLAPADPGDPFHHAVGKVVLQIGHRSPSCWGSR
ncbi:unannotated protein [freshwater metagenome]|uniref:Unannotated protein n=1 Tax=freshwater metagenome TaxID=449393 RepID=A0A6J7QJU0_9ZZZZ